MQLVGFPSPNFLSSFSRGGPLKIVALGSSSTAGEGDVVSYVYRLQSTLRRKFSGRMVDVLNRGIVGQEAPEEFDRMEKDVVAERPSLVVWQVGTNAVWQRGRDLHDAIEAVGKGLAMLASASIDVVLMDLQYAPALLTEDKIDRTNAMLSAIAEAGRTAKVNVFGRFDFMRRIVEVERVALDRLIDPDDVQRLHQSDWCARRIAYELGEAVASLAAPHAPSPSHPDCNA